MKIHISDGSVMFADDRIGRHTDRPSFLRSRIGRSAKETSVNGPWTTYSVSPEPGVSGDVIFEGDRLRQICLLFRLPSDDETGWSEDAEQQRLALHDAWLRAEIGEPPYRYAWGQIESKYDPRGGVSDIVFAYAN